MIVPVQKKSVFEDISEQIQNQIENGTWKEGEKIQGEFALAELFQVSRGSIREAIKSLQLMGILEARSGQGTFVAQNAVQKIRDNKLIEMINDDEYRDQILECRYMIEPQAAFVAAQICTEEDIAHLQHLYEEMMHSSDLGELKKMNMWGQLFHSYIVDLMKNEILSAIYKTIEQQLLNERETFAKNNENNVVISYHHEHEELIEAFKKHDAVLARKIMDKHLSRQMHWKRLIKE